MKDEATVEHFEAFSADESKFRQGGVAICVHIELEGKQILLWKWKTELFSNLLVNHRPTKVNRMIDLIFTNYMALFSDIEK